MKRDMHASQHSDLLFMTVSKHRRRDSPLAPESQQRREVTFFQAGLSQLLPDNEPQLQGVQSH